MPAIDVRISEEEKSRPMKYGRLSDTFRSAAKLYLGSRESDKLLAKLEGPQRASPVDTTSPETARMIKEDRTR